MRKTKRDVEELYSDRVGEDGAINDKQYVDQKVTEKNMLKEQDDK